MPSTLQLKIWRKQAANRLFEILTRYTGDEIQPIDAHADTLLRQLSQLPPRPSDRAPFQGSFPDVSLSVARVKTANRLKQLVANLSDNQLQSQDGWVDDALRSMLEKPARGSDETYREFFPATSIESLTIEMLLEIAPDAATDRVSALHPHLFMTMAVYDITTPLRQAHFLAQLVHESGSFQYVEEIDPGDYLENRTDLGNTEPGDGSRYKGRGLIQITGRNNYAACGEDLGIDLIAEPTLLMQDDWACLSAGWFWSKNQLNELADADDVEQVTQTINGGFNGFEERQYFLGIAKSVLQA